MSKNIGGNQIGDEFFYRKDLGFKTKNIAI